MSDSAHTSAGSRYFKLGLFVLIAMTLIIAGVIVLGAGALFEKKLAAETLVYDSVNGLDVGSAVKYRGLPIGKVTKLIFASAKYAQPADSDALKNGRSVRGILIEMELNVRAFPGPEAETVATAKRLIERGMRARVTPAGLGGQSYIEFDILDPEQFPPPFKSWEPDVLYIPSAPSSFGEVVEAAADIASELQRAHLGQLVNHVDQLSQQATAAVGDVSRLVNGNKDNLNRTLAELPDTAVRLRQTVARADEILHDPRVDKALNGASGLGDSADKVLADVRRLVDEAEQLLAGESDDIRSIVSDLRRLAADGAAVTEDAKGNPSRLLFGKPPPPPIDGKQ